MNTEIAIKSNYQVGTIEFDNTQAKEFVLTKIQEHKDNHLALIKEDNLKGAKDQRAKLRKFAKAFDDERKSIKKIMTDPIKQYEEKVREVLTPLYEYIDVVDKDIKKVEIEIDKAKEQTILDYLTEQLEIVGYNNDVVHLFTVQHPFNDKWLNKTYKLDDIKKEISTSLETFHKEYSYINNIDEPQRKVLALREFNNGSSLADIMISLDDFKRNTEQLETESLNTKASKVYNDDVESVILRFSANKETIDRILKGLDKLEIPYLIERK